MIIETEFMLSRDSHVEEELLERYSMGRLPDADVASVEEHVLICEACQEKLAHMDSWVRSIRRATADWQPEERWSWQLWRLPRLVPALAAAVLLVLAAGLVVKMNNRGVVAPLAVALQATRGENAASVPARQPLLIQPGLEGLPQFPEYRLEIVDRLGKQVRQASLTPGGANIPGISPGTYFVRLYSPAGELLREYALEARDAK